MKLMKISSAKLFLLRFLSLIAVLCLLPVASFSEAAADEWFTFLLVCNEGMNNDKGNAGNTMMIVSMAPDDGRIRLLEFTWDTFVEYEGYDVPQRLDMPYRNGGAEEVMKVFDDNFGMDIDLFLSLNFLNLAELINDYGGVTVDLTRAERNALNGMVASKKWTLKSKVGTGLLSQAVIDMLADEYYLEDFGPETHLNGLQGVGYGWLQYDSVYNCCERELEVIASLFGSVADVLTKEIVFYTDETGKPDNTDGKYAINLDNMTADEEQFLRQAIDPIFEKSYHNLTEEQIRLISLAMARAAYAAARQGVNIFETVDCLVLPLEAKEEYQIIAGAKGHIIDTEANKAAIMEFLYGE